MKKPETPSKSNQAPRLPEITIEEMRLAQVELRKKKDIQPDGHGYGGRKQLIPELDSAQSGAVRRGVALEAREHGPASSDPSPNPKTSLDQKLSQDGKDGCTIS
jgi:hypothetical protein